ncbi:MAG: cell surface protein [Oscillospiraceae bacterium]|jgi:predicted Zn-dependent protease|nr:cell surface protein [Oscillospiraceae bacterium]
MQVKVFLKRALSASLLSVALLGVAAAFGGADCGTSTNGTTTISIITSIPHDLVDSGKHCDYDSNQSKYDSYVKTAVATWNAYKPGVFRPDDGKVLQDVRISDVNNEGNGWTGITNLAFAYIHLNKAYLDDPSYNFNYNNILHTVTHELGHALGLDENNDGLPTNVMRQGKRENISLSTDDKASYDAAYARY